MATLAKTPTIDQPEAPPPIESTPISDAAMAMWDEIQSLGLAEHIAELEIKGYTVIPPEKVAPRSFTEAMLETAIRVAERRSGIKLTRDMAADDTPDAMKWAFGLPISYAMLEEPILQEALLNPTGLAMTTYMLGRNALLSGCSIMFKGPGGIDLPLHADSFRLPDPLPALPQICNITWALTDYTRENGALAIVPGSHKFLRRPLKNEGWAERVPVEAKAGSIIAFGGQVWHGAYARTAPGFRCGISMYMCRPHLITQEAYNREVPQELLDRHPKRFAVLMGRRIDYGWKQDGPGASNLEEDAGDSAMMGSHAWD